ncbi:hypothetical protein AB833_18805 [Chromatiales bacterium (ex Bugula neritina AB1)]|nr:hypothetical protein AB833_18805 [Chromatiales bacterium (ex Bugula neritina AB1)]
MISPVAGLVVAQEDEPGQSIPVFRTATWVAIRKLGSTAGAIFWPAILIIFVKEEQLFASNDQNI